MCSNFDPIKINKSSWVSEHFKCELPQGDWDANVYSTAPVPFVYLDDGQVKCELAQFGLVPPWAKDKKRHGRHTYNARTETVHTTHSYASPWRKCKFGLVLANKFYEPLYDASGKNWVPAGIFRSDGGPTAIASIWERFVNQDTGEVTFSFSMLTVNADEHPLMSRFHKPKDEKRSVVVVEDKDFTQWLNAKHDNAKELLKLSRDGYLDYSAPEIKISQKSLF